jgi:preprotein translocase subunit SecF
MQLPSNIDFMGVRKIASVISITLVIVSILALFFNSLQFGLDFTSGTSVRLGYSDTVVLGEVNSSLINNGYEDAVVVSFGRIVKFV